jgi:hypothetical protein
MPKTFFSLNVTLEGAFRLIRKTVDKLNKHAAKMLPLSTNELTGLDLRGEPLGLASMRNKTMEWLRRYGQCLDDAELKESDNSVSLVAKRQFKFGDVVLPIPLYATTSHDVCTSGNAKEECSVGLQSFYRHCYGHNETSLLLCPLSFAALATRSDDPNVMLRWSPWNSENKASQHHTPDHVVKVRFSMRAIGTHFSIAHKKTFCCSIRAGVLAEFDLGFGGSKGNRGRRKGKRLGDLPGSVAPF